MVNKPKVVVIVQARMGSTRLPGKMLLPIVGKPIIDFVLERAKQIPNVDHVVLATTDKKADDPLAKRAEVLGVEVYRGSEDDVLDRYFQAAKLAKADVVMRVTGDCPLLDPMICGEVLATYLKGGIDYATNTKPPTYPDGLDTEAFSFKILERAWTEAKLQSEREHVTPYIWKHPEIFKIKNVTRSEDLSGERWTLDTKEDYEFIKKIIESLPSGGKSDMLSIFEIIRHHPEWKVINSKYQRDEGYAKSINDDKKNGQ